MADLRGNSTPVPAKYNALLIVAAGLSAIAAVLHVAIIFGGAPWYRFFGAGERMASAAAAGQWYPPLVTALIALVLAVWGAYALSGAGVIPRLPMLKPVLCAITAVYLLRAGVIFPRLLIASGPLASFDIWSSLICMIYGAVHLFGLVQVWKRV